MELYLMPQMLTHQQKIDSPRDTIIWETNNWYLFSTKTMVIPVFNGKAIFLLTTFRTDPL
ncbi:10175_t:CDS:1 [Diversispora eburnea]|uniref:10175_t:CDS:1 n=1 Tax=Diversispora eburnea TaxID=1213867 RepID=A0A9N8WH00_9GLOM|nr:10175_t:CDS:1 [Diversispora eburnea]